MPDMPGCQTIDANKTQPAKDALGAGYGSQCFAIAQAVLQGEHLGMGVQHRRNHGGKMVIGSRLPGHDNQIDRADFLRRAEALDLRQGEISMHAIDSQAIASDGLEIRAQQKPHILSGLRETPAVIQADRPGTDQGHAVKIP
jgi:uncharacterized protein YhdP